MKCKSWSNIFLGITCAFCIFIAFLVFIVALIYMSVFVLSTPKSVIGGCSKMDQYKGIECAPKIEELSQALEQIETNSHSPASFDKVREIADVCRTTLNCVEPIKCKSITREYEFVKNSCAMFEIAASDVNFCLKKLQKHYITSTYLVAPTSCLPLLETPSVHQIMCQLYKSNGKCSKTEVEKVCGPDITDKYQELLDKIQELFECPEIVS